jgi:hypothetical protein
VGDVGAVTANVGLAARAMRIIAGSTQDPTRPTYTVESYDPSVYSDVVAIGPSIVDTNLPNPASLPAPTALVITETAFLEQVNGSALAGSLIYQSRFDVSWTPPTFGLPLTYRVEVYDGPTKIRDEQVSASPYSTPALQQGKTYTVKVYARTTVKESAALSGSQNVLGSLLPPAAPTILSGRELGGDVLLQIAPPLSVDTTRWEWRYFPNGAGTWATATFIDRVDVLGPRFKGLPVGTHRFYVASTNAVGIYSTTQASIDITVTSDANAFINSRTFTNPAAGGNIVEITTEGDANRRWATAVTGDQWSAIMPSPLNSGGNPVSSYHANGTSKFQGEIWDLGASISGSWTMTAAATAISGAISFYIETSPDAVNFTRQPGLSFQGSARAVRPVIEALVGATLQVDAPPSIALAVLSKPETGIVTTNASGITLVPLTGKYSAAQDLQATALGNAAKYATRDRLLVYPQAGLMLSFDVVADSGGGADAFLYRRICNPARTLLVDDYLECEVWLDGNNPAANTGSVGGNFNQGQIWLHTAAAGGSFLTAGTINTDMVSGQNMRTGASLDARGAWVARKFFCGGSVGTVVDGVDIGNDNDTIGSYKVLVRNARFTNGAGVDRQAVWPPTLGGSTQTEPSTNANSLGGNGGAAAGRSQNAQCGPANTFTVYAFNSAGAQVANDVSWSFKGF